MAFSAWIRYIAVVILIGCCSCKFVLITDHRNAPKEKGGQKERSSKQRPSKVRMSSSSRSLTDMTELGLIGQGQNGQIFETLLSDNSDGVSAPRQSIENFIDSFSTLFRPISVPQTIISNTDDNAVPGDDVNFIQGVSTSLRRGSGNIVPSDNVIGRARVSPGQRQISMLPSDISDDTLVQTLGRMTSRGIGGMVSRMSDGISFDDTRSAESILGQSNAFNDVLFADTDQSRREGGPVMRGGNDGTSIINQRVRLAPVSISGQSRPSVRIRGDMRSSQVQGTSSDIQGSNIVDRNSLFNTGFDELGDARGANMLVPTEERLNQVSTLRTDATNAGRVGASSLGNSLISNLLSRIFSTPSGDNDASLTVIDNALSGIDASQSENGGDQLFTRMATDNRITGDGQAASGGQEREVRFNDVGDFNTGDIGSTGMQELSRERESGFDQKNRRQDWSTEVERGQRINDGNIGFGSKARKDEQSENRLQGSKRQGSAVIKGSRMDSREGSRRISPTKTRPSKKGTGMSVNVRNMIGRQFKTDTDDSRKVDSTKTDFVSRGPYMVFQTSKPTRTKTDGSNKFGTSGLPSSASTKGSASSPFSGAGSSVASGKQIGRPASQTPVSSFQTLNDGSVNGDSFRMQFGASGSMQSTLSSGFPRNTLLTQGNTAISSRSSSARVGNGQSSTRTTSPFSSVLGGGGRPGVPVRVFMILPTRASGSRTGVTASPSAIETSRTRVGQVSGFNPSRGSPFGMSGVSMGSTSNLGGTSLLNRGNNRAGGRPISTLFGNKGTARGTGSFSGRISAGRDGNVWTSSGATLIKPGQGTFQGRMKMPTGGTY
ncbi:uncharacterized protein LOC117334748 [Pecten maximus]|uniref:uncharacterized protein LOC117334748 n=1 Tax=Pecten maximus TaxID=6579 RepID=UPI001458B276|nr:uncharacterized protein LOC117334748 [Pecten maximus]XP_033750434.1 uncharacterized protein LOC117334748 [Pecten maximus]